MNHSQRPADDDYERPDLDSWGALKKIRLIKKPARVEKPDELVDHPELLVTSGKEQ